MDNQEFREGDNVEWLGARGIIKTIHTAGIAKVQVTIHGRGTFYFHEDGRFYSWQKPSLVLLSRKKVLVKKYRVFARTKNGEEFVSLGVYKSLEDYNRMIGRGIQILEATMIEVEE